MTRRQPVAFFLGDVSFLADPKFRALQRRLPDPDDFNSAVGAFFVALAAARRNGDAHVDAAEETGSKFIPDLQAVGLLNGTGFHADSFDAWAPQRPQSIAGQARAAGAQRGPGGQFSSAHAGQHGHRAGGTDAGQRIQRAGDAGDAGDEISRSNVQRAGVAGEAGPASPPFLSTPSMTARAQRGPDYCENPAAHRDRWIEPFEGVGLVCLECAPRDPLPELVLA